MTNRVEHEGVAQVERGEYIFLSLTPHLPVGSFPLSLNVLVGFHC